jgi:hypothetical protein
MQFVLVIMRRRATYHKVKVKKKDCDRNMSEQRHGRKWRDLREASGTQALILSPLS